MEALIRLAQNVVELTPRDMFNEIFRQRPAMVKFVISLNLYNQLFDQGVDSEGRVIGYYKPETQRRRPNKIAGTPYTLHDTGEFYDSVRVELLDGELEFRSDEMKDDGSMVEIYGDSILGLTQESQEMLIGAIKNENIADILEKLIFGGIV